jgi:hypothetical protein
MQQAEVPSVRNGLSLDAVERQIPKVQQTLECMSEGTDQCP